MKRSLSVLSTALSFVMSINSAASCDWKDYIPNLDGSSCAATAKLALPFLQEEKKIREDKINRAIGSGLVKSIAAQMGQISDSDFIYHHFEADLDSKQTQCSLENLKKELPCATDRIDQNLKKYSGGEYKNMDSFFDTISREYLKNIQVETKLSAKHCMSSAMKKEYNFNLFLNSYRDVDLIGFIKRINNDSQTPSDKNLFERLYKYLPPDFHIENVDLAQIKGANFKEQLSSLFHDESLKRVSEQRVALKCRAMFTTMKKILCSDIEDYHVGNAHFNKSVLGYDEEPVAAGFDLDEIDFAGGDPNQLYPQFILNCPTDNDNDTQSEEQSVDGVLASFAMPFQSIRKTYNEQKYRSKNQTNISPDKEKSICTLLACENFKEVDQGQQCQLRDKPRSMVELNKVLSCPADDQCRTPSFRALTSIFNQKQVQAQLNPTQAGGLSSFAQSFITNKVLEQVASAAVTPAGAAITTSTSSEPSLGESISSPVVDDRRDSTHTTNTMTSTAVVPHEFSAATHRAPSTAVAPVSAHVSGPTSAQSFAALRDKMDNMNNLNKDERMKAMETQRKTMEDMLAAIKSGADVQKALVNDAISGQRTTLPEISQANQVVSTYSANSRTQDDRLAQYQRDNDNFLARIHRAQAIQNREGSRSSVPGGEVERRGSGLVNPSGTPGASALQDREDGQDGSTTTASGNTAPTGEQLGTGSVSRSDDSSTTRVNAINALLDKFSALNGRAKVETTSQEIVGLSLNKLRASGIALDTPFVIVVKDVGGEYTIPVRPSVYRGKRILTPLLNENNAKISSLLRKSPLFKDYFHYQDRV